MKDEKWIEQIRVRSSAFLLQEAMPSLQEQMQELAASAQNIEIFCLQHALYRGDLAVVVVWGNQTQPQKTREGLMIAEKLQSLGSIEHAVWRSFV